MLYCSRVVIRIEDDHVLALEIDSEPDNGRFLMMDIEVEDTPGSIYGGNVTCIDTALNPVSAVDFQGSTIAALVCNATSGARAWSSS